MKKVVFITPAFNAESHVEDLVESMLEQTNPNWQLVFIDDMSEDDTCNIVKKFAKEDKRIQLVENTTKKWALRNVVENARQFENEEDTIIAVIDGDDALCNENTVEILIREYSKDDEIDSIWTSHSWDINSMNISRGLPQDPKINPYQYPWVSSHLKTWRASMLSKISDTNFKDLDNEWFKRGYDQALYLPILYLSRKRKHVDEICYLYRINSNSIKKRVWGEKTQLDTVRLVRARGLI